MEEAETDAGEAACSVFDAGVNTIMGDLKD